MQKHIVTIIHLILIAILLVAGLLLLVDMHHVSQRCTNQEIFSGQEEQEVILQGGKPNSGKTAKSMREQAVMEMTKALDGMTADVKLHVKLRNGAGTTLTFNGLDLSSFNQ